MSRSYFWCGICGEFHFRRSVVLCWSRLPRPPRLEPVPAGTEERATALRRWLAGLWRDYFRNLVNGDEDSGGMCDAIEWLTEMDDAQILAQGQDWAASLGFHSEAAA